MLFGLIILCFIAYAFIGDQLAYAFGLIGYIPQLIGTLMPDQSAISNFFWRIAIWFMDFRNGAPKSLPMVLVILDLLIWAIIEILMAVMAERRTRDERNMTRGS